MTSQSAPAWREFIEELGETPALYGKLAEIQGSWEKLLGKMAAKYEVPKPDESVQTRDINLDNFWLRVYTPPYPAPNRPLGICYHGGGWAMGSVDQEDAVCRLISKYHQITLVSPSYRLAPVHKYPAALDDCVETVNWSCANLQASSVILIGASAGGNLAFGAALKLIDQGKGELVKGVIALVPVTVHPDAVPAVKKGQYTAYDDNADATVNTRSAMWTFLGAYGASPTDTYTSCLLHPKLNQLKKVYIAECGSDTLRDDARLMKGALEEANVPLTYHAYPGFPHYSWTFPSKLLNRHREEFLSNMLNGVQWVGGLK
ncbi:alpha/beta hydrolase [Aspergillus undulatus]|uniref:alpha/beta hydrolase n=1 Tax=Aspergillus undulatus TaxID=1810928 RepID=UPI003CCDF61A